MESALWQLSSQRRDAWQLEAAETCTTETQLRDREQESIEVADFEDPSTSGAEVRELDEFEVKLEVDESEMRMTPGKNI